MRRSCLPPKHTWFATRAYLRPPPNGDPGSCLNRQSNHRRSPIRPLPLRPQPPGQIPAAASVETTHGLASLQSAPHEHGRNYTWAEMMKRVFQIEVLECPRCLGRMRIVAAIHPPDATRKILDCLGLPSRATAGSSCILQIFGPTGMVLRRPKSRCRIGVPSACAIST